MAALIPDEKCLILLIQNFWLIQYAAGYHPGPVAPPRTDEASLKLVFWNENLKCRSLSVFKVRKQKPFLIGDSQNRYLRKENHFSKFWFIDRLRLSFGPSSLTFPASNVSFLNKLELWRRQALLWFCLPVQRTVVWQRSGWAHDASEEVAGSSPAGCWTFLFFYFLKCVL